MVNLDIYVDICDDLPWDQLHAKDLQTAGRNKAPTEEKLASGGKNENGLRVGRENTGNLTTEKKESSTKSSGTEIMRVFNIKYLGSVVSSTANCTKDVKTRIK